MTEFTDRSYPPVGSNLVYQRGDGAVVDLKIAAPPAQPPATCPVPANQPDRQRTRATASVTIPTGVPIKINPKARVNVRDGKPQVPATIKQAQQAQQQYTDETIIDHPAVGGKFTVFVLFYGDYFDLHRKCLTSLLATVKANRIDLRVGSNAVCPQTLAMINDFIKQGFITKHYQHTENAYKYPVMREMFWDESCPITTKWVLWFDDDSICDVDPLWMNKLAQHIIQDPNAHMLGGNYVWSTNKRQRDILASRPWYTGKPWRDKGGNPSPNGNKIVFATGGFWALTLEALRKADVPDLETGLTHTGGDWQIGEQIYQSGFKLRQFNGQKQFVRTSSVPRRGATQPTIDQVTMPPTSAPPIMPAPDAPPVTPVQPPVLTAQPPPPAPEPPATVPHPRRIVDL